MDDARRVSYATCMCCGYVWVAVVPNECTAPLECPACHAQWGIEEPASEGENDGQQG